MLKIGDKVFWQACGQQNCVCTTTEPIWYRFAPLVVTSVPHRTGFDDDPLVYVERDISADAFHVDDHFESEDGGQPSVYVKHLKASPEVGHEDAVGNSSFCGPSGLWWRQN